MIDVTLETYERSAAELAHTFMQTGARVDDIERAFSFANAARGELRVLELGCGDGRDAAVIAPQVQSYKGVDYSGNLLELARSRGIEGADFEVADMRGEVFSEHDEFDIIFGFASLLHLNGEELSKLFSSSADALSQGGIWYASMRYADSYSTYTRSEALGDRVYYLYHPDEVLELAGDRFTEEYREQQEFVGFDWFTLVLRNSSND